MVKPYIPEGCDQQGRYPEHAEPAEACTDIGADEVPEPDHDMVKTVLRDVAIVAMVLLMAAAAVLKLLEARV